MRQLPIAFTLTLAASAVFGATNGPSPSDILEVPGVSTSGASAPNPEEIVARIEEAGVLVVYSEYSNPNTVDARDSLLVCINMLEDLTRKMAAFGDGPIPVRELHQDYRNKVSLWINNDVRPGTVTYRMLALILLYVGQFLRRYNMKLTQFLILDAVQELPPLMFGNLYKLEGGAIANITSRFGFREGVNAPKTLPPLAKQNLILQHLQNSRTAHTIKELEKSLPSVASINGMQVKDYLQALSDEGKIHVEKIGSGNWYWSFLSEEKNTRDIAMADLKAEKEKIEVAMQELEEKMREASDKKGEDEGRAELVEAKIILDAEVAELKKELEGYKDGDPAEVEKRRKAVEGFKANGEKWTDNILILEGYLKSMMGGDLEALDGVKRQVYGNEYVEGEGLEELRF
ncbi:MAG: hypothetical protein Q9217_002461 [Psora testacea]